MCGGAPTCAKTLVQQLENSKGSFAATGMPRAAACGDAEIVQPSPAHAMWLCNRSFASGARARASSVSDPAQDDEPLASPATSDAAPPPADDGGGTNPADAAAKERRLAEETGRDVLDAARMMATHATGSGKVPQPAHRRPGAQQQQQQRRQGGPGQAAASRPVAGRTSKASRLGQVAAGPPRQSLGVVDTNTARRSSAAAARPPQQSLGVVDTNTARRSSAAAARPPDMPADESWHDSIEDSIAGGRMTLQ